MTKRAKAPSRLWAVIFANTGNVFQVCTQKWRAEHIARTREDKEMRVVEYAAREAT